MHERHSLKIYWLVPLSFFLFTFSISNYSETGHLRDLPKCPLNRDQVVKIAQCLLTINIQGLLCTVVKLKVVKETIQSSSS